MARNNTMPERLQNLAQKSTTTRPNPRSAAQGSLPMQNKAKAAMPERLQTLSQNRQAPQTVKRAQPVQTTVQAPAAQTVDKKVRPTGGAYKDNGRIETPRPVTPTKTNR